MYVTGIGRHIMSSPKDVDCEKEDLSDLFTMCKVFGPPYVTAKGVEPDPGKVEAVIDMRD